MQLKTPSIHDIKNKKVLVRVDFNVPLKEIDGHWRVADDTRIKAALPTLEFLIQHQAKIILCSHLGRPDGKPNPKFSLAPVARHLKTLLKTPVLMSEDVTGAETREAITELEPGEVLVIENLRFDPGEEKNDTQFARELASLADVYVNDAFSASHRAHASIVGVTNYLPSFAGMSFVKEVETLNKLLHEPRRPFVVVVGGAKISDKVSAVQNLAKIADAVLIGGGTANNFLKAEGIDIHKSFVEEAQTNSSQRKRAINYVAVAEEMIEATHNEKILLDGYIPLPKIIMPIDVVAAPTMESRDTSIIDLTNDGDESASAKNLMYLDIGPKTIKLYTEIISQAHTVFWNGPMGVFEESAFAQGTLEVAKAISKVDGTAILGGGDTISAIDHFDLTNQFDYISAAGGAALEFLSGDMLPGVEPLLEKK